MSYYYSVLNASTGFLLAADLAGNKDLAYALAAGNYTVNVKYGGNANFTGNDSNKSFEVKKAKTNVTVTVSDVIYNETVNVAYVLKNIETNGVIPDGEVTITVYKEKVKIKKKEN